MSEVEHEVIGADLPPEPPVRTIVMDANNDVYQRIKWTRYLDIYMCSPTFEWTGVGERKHADRPTWMELLNRGSVTVLWRAPAEPAAPAHDTESDDDGGNG